MLHRIAEEISLLHDTPNVSSALTRTQFEADSEDDEMENEIDSNLDQLHGA